MPERRRVTRMPRQSPPLPAPPFGREGKVKTTDLGLFTGRKPVCIGIDQSLVAFGLAAYSPEDGTAFCWLFHPASFGVRRLFYINTFIRMTLQQIILRCSVPAQIAMEGYSYGSHAGREALGECGAVVKMALVGEMGLCDQLAYPAIVSPQQVKKFVTGKGNAKKNEMLLAVYRKWDVTFDDDNLADAYALARVAAALATGETKYDYEQEVIRRIARNTEWELPTTATSTSSKKGRKPSSE